MKAVEMHRQERAAAEKRTVSATSGQLEAGPDRLSAKLLNNAAVLHLRAGHVTAALELMEEALEVRPGPAGAPHAILKDRGYPHTLASTACLIGSALAAH